MEIGDSVEIIDKGCCYSTYADKAVQLEATSWVNGRSMPYGMKEATIDNIDDTHVPTIYLIANESGEQYLIDNNGLSFIEKAVKIHRRENYYPI